MIAEYKVSERTVSRVLPGRDKLCRSCPMFDNCLPTSWLESVSQPRLMVQGKLVNTKGCKLVGKNLFKI